MKKAIVFFIGLSVIISCTSEDTVVELDEFFPATLDSGKLTEAYGAVRYAGTANHGGYFSIQSISSDEMAITQKGGDWYDGGIWLDMHRHTWTPANGPITGTWAQQYSAISTVNTVIGNAGLNSNEIAQARVIRAYLHWRLMDLYGNIIIADGSGSNAQSSRTAVFNWIESELLSALGMGSEFDLAAVEYSNLGTADNKYRINRYAALGILAKLYLNAEVYTGISRYADAAAASGYVIDNGSYRLSDSSISVTNLGKRPSVDTDPDKLTGYAALFAPNNSDNPEIIWSLDYEDSNAGGFFQGGMNFSQMSIHYSGQVTWNFQAQPWNGYVALEEFVHSYQEADLRKKNNFIIGPQYDYNGYPILDLASNVADPHVSYSVAISELEPNAGRTEGARFSKFSFQQFGAPDMNNDYPVVRLGDLHLIHAEAIARDAGDWSLALPEINAIRLRAGVAELAIMTADQFLAERGREMFQEASRRTDLIRFGRWGESWWEKGASADYRTIFPIPTEQLTANPNLSQNPGY